MASGAATLAFVEHIDSPAGCRRRQVLGPGQSGRQVQQAQRELRATARERCRKACPKGMAAASPVLIAAHCRGKGLI
jgi:hypothetical protein